MDEVIEYQEPLGARLFVKSISNGVFMSIEDTEHGYSTSITIDKDGVKSIIDYLSKLVEEK